MPNTVQLCKRPGCGQPLPLGQVTFCSVRCSILNRSERTEAMDKFREETRKAFEALLGEEPEQISIPVHRPSMVRLLKSAAQISDGGVPLTPIDGVFLGADLQRLVAYTLHLEEELVQRGVPRGCPSDREVLAAVNSRPHSYASHVYEYCLSVFHTFRSLGGR